MIILGIETSCDETAIAVLQIKSKKNPRFRILSNVIASQAKLHATYGGVFPSLAKREHEKNLPIVLTKALKEAKTNLKDIHGIAVTQGPGLDPCLWAGLNFAKELAEKARLPLIPVDHMEGHLLVGVFFSQKAWGLKNVLPALALLVSGGHTQLVLMKGIWRYKVLGETRDDAAGECFDKTARVLGLPYPGGPAIAAAAAQIRNPKSLPHRQAGEIRNKFKIKLPRPMMHTKDYDFSFSGLKTAVLYDFQSRTARVQKSKEYIRTMAKEIQQAIIDVLAAKTLRAAREYRPKSVIIGGGVAANDELRTQLRTKIRELRLGVQFLAGPKELCTDNGLMPAVAGFFKLSEKKQGAALNRIGAQPNLRLE